MRRKDREIIDMSRLLDIIGSCRVCRIAMQDSLGLYIVPMNFGYEYETEKLTLYFHSAGEGRKLAALAACPDVCFEMDCGHCLIEAENACGYGYSFQSIIGYGRAQIVGKTDEKQKALCSLMRQQTGKDFSITAAMTEAVTVFKIDVSSMTGKARE